MGVMDSFAAHLLLRLQLKNEEMKAGLADTRRAADAAMQGVAGATQKASDEQKKLEDQVDKVGDALDGSAAKAKSWGDRASEAFAKGLDAFEAGVGKVGDGMKNVGEVFEKANRSLKTLGFELDPAIAKFGELAKNVGELAIEAAKLPHVIRQIADAMPGGGNWARGGRAAPDSPFLDTAWQDETSMRMYKQLLSGQMGNWGGTREQQIALLNPSHRAALEAWDAINASPAGLLAYGQGAQAQSGFNAYAAGLVAQAQFQETAPRGGGGGGGGRARDPYRNASSRKLIGYDDPGLGPVGSYDLGFGALGVDVGGGYGMDAPGRLSGADAAANFTAPLDGLAETYQRLSAQVETAAKKSIFESIFGPPEEISAYAEGLETVSGVIGVLSGALQQSFDAWVSGSQTAGEALKALPAAVLGGISSMMWAKSLQHGAEALSALIPGFSFNPAAAAGHAKVAAVFAAGAIAVGGVARQFGGTAPGAGAGSGAGAYGGSGPVQDGASRGPQPETRNIYIGDVWADDNPRNRRAAFARTYRSSRRELEQTRGVAYR